MKVYLLRHGQTEYNVDKRYQGTRDIPLSEKGRAALRREYIDSVLGSLKGQLDHTYIVDKKGNKTKLKKKGE